MRIDKYIGSAAIRFISLAIAILAVAVFVFDETLPMDARSVWLKVVGFVLAAFAFLGAIHSFRGFYTGWMRFARWLNVVATVVALTVIYFSIVPPMAVVMRWIDPLRIRRAAGTKTFWVTRKQAKLDSDSLQRMG